MKEKVSRLEKDTQQLRDDQEKHVTFAHFEAVIEPLTKTVENVQKDVKEILHAIMAKANHQDH